MTRKFFLLFLVVGYLQKTFRSFKSAEKNLKHFFAFKIRAFCLQACPGDWDLVYRRRSYSWRHIVSFCQIWCCFEVHNVTSRSDFGRAMTGTNSEANCVYLSFRLFSKLQNVFQRYPTTRNKRKNFRVICALKYNACYSFTLVCHSFLKKDLLTKIHPALFVSQFKDYFIPMKRLVQLIIRL